MSNSSKNLLLGIWIYLHMYKVILYIQEYSLHLFLNKFIYLFLALLGLHCCARAFSSCVERGLLFVTVCGLLIAVASLCCGARALGARDSVVVARGLSSCGSWA